MRKIIIAAFCFIIFFGIQMDPLKGEEKPAVNVYGYIKADGIYETGNSSHGNFIIWARDPGQSNGLFYLTAKETRIGAAVSGFGFGKFKVSGKLEVDFQSTGTEENKPYNYMRHAYLEISNGSLAIIVGQTWDIISPLNPVTLNYPVMWGAGNIGYRRPQLSMRYDAKAGQHVVTVQAGVFRTIASDYDNDSIEDGAAAGFPTVQGRVAGKVALSQTASLQVGVSGHYGKSKGVISYTSDSLNLDLLWVFSPQFKIIAEAFTGKNLGTYFGGIVQYVNPALGKEIASKGFYVNGVVNPSKKLQFSVGYGVDNPDDQTLSTGMRSKNQSYWGNVLINLSSSLKVGFEVSNWITDYLARAQQESLRLQHSWILYF
ncbi:MAG: hypothetical protein ACM3SY_13205 [Candidatus Omnitrophota bacterium]